MAKKEKSCPSNIIEKKVGALCMSTKDYFSDEYFNDCAKQPKWREKLIDALYEFSSLPDSVFIVRFCQKYNIRRESLYYVRDRYPDVKKAYDDFIVKLACNRHDGARLKKFDNCVFKGIGRLDPEYLEDMKVEAEINKKQDPTPPAINVYMEKPEVLPKE